jgi:hypothetical protein
MANDSHGETIGHKKPRRPQRSEGQPALVVAFPTPAAIPLPRADTPVGRDYFASHGYRDGEISKSHFRVTTTGSTAHIEDAGSRNGTWIDGKRIDKPTPLEDGTVIRVGNSILVHREGFEGALDPSPPLGGLIGPFGLRAVASRIDTLSKHPPRNVFIEGETGTGKEMLAAFVAGALGRSTPYAAVNVAGVASGVFESQLFGHVAGAFSDAKTAALGVVRAHEGGTVFLDEIAELPLTLQPKILRLLENHEVLPVGSDSPVKVDVLLLAASSRPMEKLVEEGVIRRDLFARLAIARVQVPPLRERVEDLFAIARHVGTSVGLELDPEQTEVEAVERLMREPWHHNVRGLIATLSEIAAVDDSPGLALWAVEEVLGARPSMLPTGDLSEASVEHALAISGGNETQAARLLGVSRGRLRRYRKIGKPE